MNYVSGTTEKIFNPEAVKETKKPSHVTVNASPVMGRTSPVISGEIRNAEIQRQVTGMDPWMVEFRKDMPKLPKDIYTNAEPEKIVTTHLVWDVEEPDFENRRLSATATYTYNNLDATNERLVLDVDSLEIESITVNGEPAKFEVVPTEKNKPDALQIQIPAKQGLGTVSIQYKTDPEASGMFWIEDQYTDGKEHPLLYTLFEPTEGASAIPGQHSPQVRLTFEVNVKTGNPELMALSSVSNNPKARSADGHYNGLRMNRAVPLYLLSLNVGNFSFQPYNDGRTGVYSEDSMIKKSAEALKELPEFMRAAEEICGPYNWGEYCPVIMCWAFPYMAMEHPCASSCGSICLEIPAVIPHELAHSWTGNDTTNCNWQQFFWNEGWTTFMETLICEKIWGTDYANMILLYSLKEAQLAIEKHRESNPEALKLCSDSKEFEFNRIPYAKGALFFFMLRDAIGHENFDQFFKDYAKVFYQNSMSDGRFLAFLQLWLKHRMGMNDFDQFKKDNMIEEWLYGTEIPSNAPEFKSKLIEMMDEQVAKVLNGQPIDKEQILEWDLMTQKIFLSRFEGKVINEQLAELDREMGYSHSKSMAVLGEWSLLCAMAGHFTAETTQMIIDYVIKRNSVHEANKITTELCKTSDGMKIAQTILQQEQGRLFPHTRKIIENNIDETNNK